MQHRSFFVYCVLAFLLAACTAASPTQGQASIDATPAITQAAPRSTQSASAALTTGEVTPTWAPTLTMTPTLPPPHTPTFDPDSPISITPAATSACPAVDSTVQPVFADQKIDGAWFDLDLSAPILEALNQGASLAALQRAVTQVTGDGKPAEISPDALYSQDLTGDGLPEVIFSQRWLLIYSCKDGRYAEILKQRSGTSLELQKESIADLNRDGLNEILVPTREVLGFVSNNYFSILRWNGSDFTDLIDDSQATVPGIAKWELKDTDGDGVLELVVRSSEVMTDDNRLHGPWRDETYIYAWNGAKFAAQPVQLDPPEYRFQAVQDGDRALRRGDYPAAVSFFIQTIESPDLKGWGYSMAHQRQREAALEQFHQQIPTQTPLPPDPNERPTLTAYAYYRLLLVYTAMGEPDKANQTYQTLLDSFTPGQPGSAYTALAKQFRETYHTGDPLDAACRSVSDYAAQHEAEILEPLNHYAFGFQNLYYEAKDICLP